MVAKSGVSAEIVVACNREIADAVVKRFEREGLGARAVMNTMPKLGELNIEPARAAILDVFLTDVIRGKRLSRRREFIESMLAATPNAVLRSVEILVRALNDGVSEAGSIAVVDIGGHHRRALPPR